MDPFTILGIIGLIAGGIAFIYIAYLVISTIISFFRTKTLQRQIRATFQQKMSNGQYKTIAVGLNRSTQEIEVAQGYKSDDIDSDLYNAHRDSEVVVWE